MSRLIDKLMPNIAETPEGHAEPRLRDELTGYGSEITADQIAIVIQKCVRYGQSSDFFVAMLNLCLQDAVGWSTRRADAALERAKTHIEKLESPHDD